jgi:Family of unknown function (DUF6228)
MAEFTIKGESEASITFSHPERDAKGWLCLYSVHVVMPGMSATKLSENPPYGSSPAKFFGELAESWRGWNGEKKWSSMEGEYQLLAIRDSLGHITLSAILRSDPSLIAPCWQASVSVMVEAGQLERLHREAEAFFAFGA